MTKDTVGGSHDLYKEVRSKIRQYDPETLLHYTLVKLYGISEKKSYEWIDYAPWDLLLLIKWILADWNNLKSTSELSIYNFNEIVNLIKDFVSESTLVLKGDDEHRLEKFIRQTAFQQFWFQSRIDKRDYGRTIELFLNTPCRFNINQKFEDIFGFTVAEFLEMALLFSGTTFQMSQLKPYVELDFLKTIRLAYGEEKFLSFLDVISINVDDAIQLCEKESQKIFLRQAYEQTIFRFRPFLRIGNRLYVIYKGLVDEFLTFGVYDFCKGKFGNAFTSYFGDTFEKYVESKLILSEIKFISERALKKIGFSHQVDFLLQGKSANVLVEVKAKEASDYLKEVPLGDALLEGYKDSIVKAVYQAQMVLVNEANKFSNNCNENSFVLIVTYKDLYLGHFEKCWSEFIKGSLEKYYKDFDVTLVNPNMFFIISISEFEDLLSIYRNDIENLVNKLREIKTLDGNPKTAKYLFSMHLDEKKLLKEPGVYSEKSFDILYDRIVEKIANVTGEETSQ